MEKYKMKPYWLRRWAYMCKKFWIWVWYRKYLKECPKVNETAYDSSFIYLGRKDLQFLVKASKIRSLTQNELDAIIATERSMEYAVNSHREKKLIKDIYDRLLV